MSIVRLITDEEATKNFNYYIKVVEDIKDIRALKQVSQIVYSLQQQANGNFLFPPGKSKEFWDAYKQKKSSFEEAMAS